MSTPVSTKNSSPVQGDTCDESSLSDLHQNAAPARSSVGESSSSLDSQDSCEPRRSCDGAEVGQITANVTPSPRSEGCGSPRSHGLERRLLRGLLSELGSPALSVVLWDGQEISLPHSEPVARLVIHDRRALWRLIVDPDMQFGEMFMAGRIAVEGDLVRFLEAFHRARLSATQKGPARRFAESTTHALRGLLSGNTLSASKANVHHHYDIGNDFYRLWLDRQMVYSCGYFPRPEASLDEAQTAKMDLICRKLELRRDELVFDVGSGWGAMAIHMAKHYGVRVKAFNISAEQLDYSRARLRREGLGQRVEFIHDDYRNITGRFDAFVSIGMLEHVGAAYYRQFGRVIDRCLTPCGRGLMHSIAQLRPERCSPWIKRRIFPGGYVPSLSQMLQIWEPVGLSIIDVENLRLHYAKTLRHWLDRFDAAEDRVLKTFDRDFVRCWRLYLSGSAAAFQSGALQLLQVLFSRPGVNDRRWTRAQMYVE